MEKLWSAFEENLNVDEVEMEIINELFFSDKTIIGEIRQSFDKWKMQDLKSLSEEIYYTSSTEDGESPINYFGIKSQYSNHAYREALIARTIGDAMWQLCNKKKKFF